MTLETTMQDALAERPDVSALACLDGSAGLLLGMYVRGEVPADLVEVAAYSAPDLCRMPPFLDLPDDHGGVASEAFVASDEWVHAYARVPQKPELLVVGLARAGTNVALLRTWLGEVAGQVGRTA